MIQVGTEHLPSLHSQKTHYDSHQNGPQYPGYLKFLNRLVKPMLHYLKKDMQGLDYGCGPGPAISHLLDKEEIRCEDYDPVYFPISIEGPYDFLFATESFEHFHDPHGEIMKIDLLLKPGGIIGLMTEGYDSLEEFKSWYYIRDYTHVCFFHQKTFEWITQNLNWEMIFTDHKRVFIFKKR